MSHYEDFARLEAIVDKLLSTVDELRRENGAMQAALRQKEEELLSARKESGGLHEERDEILSRVNRLISTIEDWEGSGAEQAEQADSSSAEDEEQPTFSLQEE